MLSRQIDLHRKVYLKRQLIQRQIDKVLHDTVVEDEKGKIVFCGGVVVCGITGVG